MPLYLISFWDEQDREASELKSDAGEDPADIHEAREIAITRWPDRSMEVWSPGRIDYFTRQIDGTA